MSRWFCVVALSVCLGASTACSLLFDPVGPADRPCPAGLSLLSDDLRDDLDTDIWWTQRDGDADFSLQLDGLHLTTGTEPIRRGAAFGTHAFYEAQGMLVFEILDLDVDFESAFFLRLDPRSGSHVAVSISGGALSLIGTDSVAFAPNYPIWLALSLQEGEAQVSTSANARDFVTIMRQPFSAEEVKVTAGLTAEPSSSEERTMTIGSIGLPPPPGCIE